MIIILDFDNTLFDTVSFKKALANIFEKYKIDFQDTYSRAKNLKGIFSLESYLALIKKENKEVDIKILKKNIKKLFENLQRFLFSDVIDFLKAVKGNELIILSLGEKRFQKKKIYGLGQEFTSLFDKIIAKPTEKTKAFNKILKLYKSRPVIFVDNYPRELEEIGKKFKHVILIRMIRGIDQYPSLKKDYKKVYNLKEVEKIINTF